jgi:hypothetical protein
VSLVRAIENRGGRSGLDEAGLKRGGVRPVPLQLPLLYGRQTLGEGLFVLEGVFLEANLAVRTSQQISMRKSDAGARILVVEFIFFIILKKIKKNPGNI